MKFDELDSKMRSLETARDTSFLAATHLVARIDGRSFTRLTKETMHYERPFDERFRNHMIATVEHVMTCGFRAVFGYTQSDEISILFDLSDDSFGRSVRKWTSVLAAEASAAFSVQIGRAAAFDCRVIELPSSGLVADYFRWRSEDALRNALNAWCYWKLREEGRDVAQATAQVEGLSVSAKNELLFQRGINFNDLPAWQRRGVGVMWETHEKPAINPKTGETATATRKRLARLYELPIRDEFSDLINKIVANNPRP